MERLPDRGYLRTLCTNACMVGLALAAITTAVVSADTR